MGKKLKVDNFKMVPAKEWPSNPPNLKAVLKNRDFLVQIYVEKYATRITVCRTARLNNQWKQEITWDELQAIKSNIGYGKYFAVECYPKDIDVVNVANMRHLFIVDQPPFAWINKNAPR